MTHYYYYILSGNILDETAHIYTVGIGTSQVEQKRYLYLLAHAASHGHYFELLSQQSSKFISRLKSTPDYANIPCTQVKSVDLVRLLKLGERIPGNQEINDTAAHQQQTLNLAYRVFGTINARRASSSAKPSTYQT